MLCEAIHWLFIFVSVIARSVVVRVFFLYHLALFLRKELHRLIHTPQPRMLINLPVSKSLLWVDLKKTSQEITCLFRNILFQEVLAFQNQLVELFHGLSLKGNCAVEHSKQDNSCAPQIYIKAVPLISKNLWCDIRRRAALLAHNLVRLNLPRYAEICNFYVAFSVQEDIVELNVSVSDVL